MTTNGSSFWTSGSIPLIEPGFLGSIISAASDIALVVSAEASILSVLVNPHVDGFGSLGHWEGRRVADVLTSESIGKFARAHETYLRGAEPPAAVELNHLDDAAWEYPVRYTFHRFGSENAALLLGRDLRQVAETQQQLVQAQIAVEQGYEARRAFDSRYRVMLSHVDDAVVFVQVATGCIDDTNGQAAALLGVSAEALTGASFAALFADRSGAELTESLINASLAERVECIDVKVAGTGTALRIEPTLFRAGGSRVLMCRLQAHATPVARAEPQAQHAAALFQNGNDAMLFVASDGAILSANDALMDLVGATHKNAVVGQNLAQFLARGQIDVGLMLGDAQSQMRVYATRFLDNLGAQVPVEVSLTRLSDGAGHIHGLIVRDVNRLEPARSGPSDPKDLPDANQKVVDLVGAASLRDIVAETTDVVEKLCIETAIMLSDNNRITAAEMLGLSRQSLYVKLRKYGLLSRD